MSTDAIPSLIDAINQDPSLQARVATLGQRTPEEASAELAKIAQELGLTLTAEEILAAGQQESAPLSDRELETVAGGFSLFSRIFPKRETQSYTGLQHRPVTPDTQL